MAADFAARTVTCRSTVSGETFPVGYDQLVIAVGARVADYGIPGVATETLRIKTATDARTLRDRILRQFAVADLPGLPRDEVDRRTTFVVCGGGATGVEVAAEIHDLLNGEMRRLRPRLGGRGRVVLVEALDRILGSFDAALAVRARERFARSGIEVMTGIPVVRVADGRVELADGQAIACGAVVWTGGNAPHPFTAELDVELRGGRIVVDDRLRVLGAPSVWAVGDCAVDREAPLPATAQVAQQQGKYLARALRGRLAGKEAAPFVARSLGMLAYIGGSEAIADLAHAKWAGRGAWLFWRSVYLTRLVSLSNKAKVLFDWWKAAVFGRDTSRF